MTAMGMFRVKIRSSKLFQRRKEPKKKAMRKAACVMSKRGRWMKCP
jgi:hypothetical protein